MKSWETYSDEELVDAVRRGESGALEALYRRHRDWVVRLAMRFCAHQEDALDVLQETFLYLTRKRESLFLRAKMTTFLYPVVKHLALKRKERRIRTGDLDAVPEPVDDSPPNSAAIEQIDALAGLLVRLSDAQREVVILRFVDGLTLAEIATALDVPVGTVKSRLHHALEVLRRR